MQASYICVGLSYYFRLHPAGGAILSLWQRSMMCCIRSGVDGWDENICAIPLVCAPASIDSSFENAIAIDQGFLPLALRKS